MYFLLISCAAFKFYYYVWTKILIYFYYNNNFVNEMATLYSLRITKYPWTRCPSSEYALQTNWLSPRRRNEWNRWLMVMFFEWKDIPGSLFPSSSGSRDVTGWMVIPSMPEPSGRKVSSLSIHWWETWKRMKSFYQWSLDIVCYRGIILYECANRNLSQFDMHMC